MPKPKPIYEVHCAGGGPYEEVLTTFHFNKREAYRDCHSGEKHGDFDVSHHPDAAQLLYDKSVEIAELTTAMHSLAEWVAEIMPHGDYGKLVNVGPEKTPECYILSWLKKHAPHVIKLYGIEGESGPDLDAIANHIPS